MFLGDPATVAVVISGLGNYEAPSLSTFDLDVTYDPAILSFNSYKLAWSLGDVNINEASDFSLGETTPGTINLSELSFLEASSTSGPFFIEPYLDEIQPDSFTLAILTFDALAVGTSDLNFHNVILGDVDAFPFSETIILKSGSISVVPEPATLLLLGCGLIGLGMLGKKRKTSFS